MSKLKRIISILSVLAVVMFTAVACGDKKAGEFDNAKRDAENITQDAENMTQNAEDTVQNPENVTGGAWEQEFSKEDAREYQVAVLKGPTAIGFIKAWEDSDNGETINKYNVTAYGAADEITAGIAKGTIDIAAVPCNLASVLYSKTDGDISVSAINTLGVLYMISSSDEIQSVKDLKGKTIYTTGQGTTPEYTLNYILTQNGLTPGEDVKIEYKAEEWNKVSDEPLITGVVIARNEVINENKKAYDEFLKDYQASVKYVNDNVEQAAQLVDKHDIIKAAVAKSAIPNCNITFISGEEMKKAVEAYLQVLYEANPQSVGGVVPDEQFFYRKAAQP